MLQLLKYNILYPVNLVHQVNHGSDNIYPNPADEHITVQYAMLEMGDRITINIVDMQGKTLKTINSENQIDELKIDISDFPKGTYNVQFVSAKQGHYTVKIVKK